MATTLAPCSTNRTMTTDASSEWHVGQEVKVNPRTWPGINKPGGIGKIVKIHFDEDGDVDSFDIKYIVEKAFESEVGLIHVSKYEPIEEPRGRRGRAAPTASNDSKPQQSQTEGKENTQSDRTTKQRVKKVKNRAPSQAKPQGKKRSRTTGTNNQASILVDPLPPVTPPPRLCIARPQYSPHSQSSISAAPSDFASPWEAPTAISNAKSASVSIPSSTPKNEVTLHQVYEAQRQPAADFALEMMKPLPETAESKARREFLARAIQDILLEESEGMDEDEVVLQIQNRGRLEKVSFALGDDEIDDCISKLCDQNKLMRSDGLIFSLF